MTENNNTIGWDEALERAASIKKEVARVIVGQEEVVEQMLVALLSRGHCLLVGVPGLAKTLLVSSIGKALGLNFSRIQFTPDLMPSDIIGSEILHAEDGKREFRFVEGPVFANLILADEINRTPPKTQSALLEAMQEKQVTVAGVSRKLDMPFVVFATQNPIEHEGTYPLPEAQLDRFFFHLNISYPKIEEERKVVEMTTSGDIPEIQTVLNAKQLIEMQNLLLDVPMPDHVLDSILKLVHSTRPDSAQASDFVKKYVAWGAGPRASQCLTLGAKALALLRGKPSASIEEVRELIRPVLRHRIIPNYNATGEGIGVEKILTKLSENVDL